MLAGFVVRSISGRSKCRNRYGSKLPTMRPNGNALLRRATIAATSSAVNASANFTPAHRLLQEFEHSGLSSSATPKWFHQRFLDHINSPSIQFPLKYGIAGTVLFSTASAYSVTHEVYAKVQPPQDAKFCPRDVVLYQYEACPFCNKVKAFLDYYDIPYKVVEVNPISKKEIKWSDYKKVPILKVDGDQMVNSSDIIDSLYKRINPEKSTFAVSNVDEERKWLEWVDNHLVHVLSPNIYRTASEALESFDYITTHGNFSLMERIIAKYTGAAAMYFIAKKLKTKHNITDERKALYDAADAWVTALKGREFNGGQEPNLADLAAFGVLRPIRHLTSGKDMVENTQIGGWYSRMENVVGKSCRVNA